MARVSNKAQGSSDYKKVRANGIHWCSCSSSACLQVEADISAVLKAPYCRGADISELNLQKGMSIRFPEGKDKLLHFEITMKPDEGIYKYGSLCPACFTGVISSLYRKTLL